MKTQRLVLVSVIAALALTACGDNPLAGPLDDLNARVEELETKVNERIPANYLKKNDVGFWGLIGEAGVPIDTDDRWHWLPLSEPNCRYTHLAVQLDVDLISPDTFARLEILVSAKDPNLTPPDPGTYDAQAILRVPSGGVGANMNYIWIANNADRVWARLTYEDPDDDGPFLNVSSNKTTIWQVGCIEIIDPTDAGE